MSFTRFYDDSYRIKKQLEETTFTGRYMLDTPGPGVDLPFMEDPQMRLEKWGANLHKKATSSESDLKGLSRPLNRDLVNINNHKLFSSNSSSVNYRNQQPFVEESRASHPAWTYRDLEQSRWETPLLNPQDGLEQPFKYNIHSRILEKDHFKPKIPQVGDFNDFYLSGPSICLGGNEEGCPGSPYIQNQKST
mgnify:CR=1 FL=1